ncbi:FAD-linked oxidase [Amycolatopsis deserti]|uniref:FAD-linked oxidase n=1 Tax=Amycolatopsis deserti TaxID=185696 RepID=A0ABQ3ITH3_9PSEU|nr:FAD-binding oxidoreductase [Amycolatopsis deserti]GHE88858.1 FAD-linked oxidase [Amycolatopsis deserti]
MKPYDPTIESALDAVRVRFRGELLEPDDPSYDEQRKLFNACHDQRPALIARCAGTADVVAAVRYATSNGLEIAVKSQGRHMAGFASADGGVVIDLAPMRSVKVDPKEQTAWVQTGANGADLEAATLVHGLGAVVGAATSTGVGGVVLHGGIGWMSPKLGWGVDTILEAEVVTADGSVLRAAPDENPDLFWALRGEAANFGVVTWIKMKLHPIGPMLAGGLIYDGAEAGEILRFLREFNLSASGDFTLMLDFLPAPAEDWIPEHLHGKLVLSVTVVHVGDDLERGRKDVQPLLDAFPPAVGELGERELLEFMLSMDADYPAVRQWYDEEQVGELTDEVIDTVVGQARLLAERGLTGYLIMYSYRGALADVPDDPGCFPRGRRGAWSIGTAAFWEDASGDEAHASWSDETIEAVRRTGATTGIVYGNVQQVPDVERHRKAHGDEAWARLRAVKKQYDPENVFHRNHNIPPA